MKSKTSTDAASSSSQPRLKLISSESSRSASVCRSCQTSPVKVPALPLSIHHDGEGTSSTSDVEGDRVSYYYNYFLLINYFFLISEESTIIARDETERPTSSYHQKCAIFSRTNSLLQKNLRKYYSTFKTVRGQDTNRSRSLSNSEMQCDLLLHAALRRSFSNIDLYHS